MLGNSGKGYVVSRPRRELCLRLRQLYFLPWRLLRPRLFHYKESKTAIARFLVCEIRPGLSNGVASLLPVAALVMELG